LKALPRAAWILPPGKICPHRQAFAAGAARVLIDRFSADVPYSDPLPSMFKMNAGYFLIQLASERDRESVYKLIGKHSREEANGVAQTSYIGVKPNHGSPDMARDVAFQKISNRVTGTKMAAEKLDVH
jgi:hypothetical protein